METAQDYLDAAGFLPPPLRGLEPPLRCPNCRTRKPPDMIVRAKRLPPSVTSGHPWVCTSCVRRGKREGLISNS